VSRAPPPAAPRIASARGGAAAPPPPRRARAAPAARIARIASAGRGARIDATTTRRHDVARRVAPTASLHTARRALVAASEVDAAVIDTPATMFRWLCLALLSATQAVVEITDGDSKTLWRRAKTDDDVYARSSSSLYYVRPDGDDDAAGTSWASAWRSIDRGMPTRLRMATPAGATTVLLERAGQLPSSGTALITVHGTTHNLTYADRNFSALLGVRWHSSPASSSALLPAGVPVESAEWSPPRGSTLQLGAGVYTGMGGWPSKTTAEVGVLYDAVVITAGALSPSQPLRIVGPTVGKAIVDGRDLSKVAFRITGTSGVVLTRVEVRRGSINTFQAKHISVTDCQIHLGTTGVEISYSDNVTLSRNIIYDIYSNGAGTAIIAEEGTGSDTINIHQNTLSSSDCCMRIAGHGNRRSLSIQRNILTQCHTTAAGLAVDPGVSLTPDNVAHNLIWKTGKGGLHLLLNDSCSKTQCDAQGYYSGLSFVPATDLHVDPGVVSWFEESPDFMAVASTSPCFSADPAQQIGARVVEKLPHEKQAPVSSTNSVLNPGFTSGLYGWWGNYQPPNPTLAGLPAWNPGSASWIVLDDGCMPGRAPCAKLKLVALPNASVDPIRFKGMSWDVERTQPKFTMQLSFSAKGLTATGHPYPLHACVSFLSYVDNYGVRCLIVHLNDTWARFNVKIVVNETWIPNVVSAEFGVTAAGFVMLDDIDCRQGAVPAVAAGLSLDLTNIPQEGIWAPNSTVKVAAQAHHGWEQMMGKAISVAWRLLVPSGKSLGYGHVQLVPSDGSMVVALPEAARGAALLVLVAQTQRGDLLANTTHRLFVGAAAVSSITQESAFQFFLTNDWHIQPAYIGSGLLRRRLETQRALGFTGHHLYHLPNISMLIRSLD
jgi:hypothetical protein